MHAHRVLSFRCFGPQAEGVVAQVLAGLDVVLVLVGPVQGDLFAFIGDGVDTGLVDALREEVALRVVPAEEAVQVVVDLVFERADVDGALHLLAKLTHLGRGVRVDAGVGQLRHHLVELALELRAVGRLILREGVLHLREKIALEELRHLARLGVHDPIDAEVEIGLIELEQLLKQGDQLLELGGVGVSHCSLPCLVVTQG